jgi:hypothetical protein
VAQALRDALLKTPTIGGITLVPHSQGGFIARQLVTATTTTCAGEGRRSGAS